MEANTDVTARSGSWWTGTGCWLRSPSTAVFRPIIGVARSKRKNVVNLWMIITLVVASLIVVANGLWRGPATELEVYWNGPLDYQAYAGTVWFAAASLLLLTYFLWTTVRGLRRNSRNQGIALAWMVVLAEVAFCSYGAANLLLESPFLASLFWAFMGMGIGMTRLLDRERLCREEFHVSTK